MFWKVVQYWDRRKSRQRWLVFVIAILAFTMLLTMFPGLDKVNWLVSDTAARLDGREPSSDIVIVTIDDDSIRAIGGWPWGREKHASLLNELGAAGAKAVGFDLIMTGPDMVSTQGDAAFREALGRYHGLVAFPIIAYPPIGAGGWVEVERPVYALTDNKVNLAHINLSPDSDGVARRIYLREGRDGVGGGVWYHMAAKLWMLGDKEHQVTDLMGRRAPEDIQQTLTAIESRGIDSSIISDGWLRDYEILIPYVGGAGSFKQYSYYDVYFGLVPKDVFRDKYVLVGAVAASGLGDVYSTPIMGDDAVMPGVEIIANILDGLLQDEYRYEATIWQNILYNLFVVSLMIPLFYLAQPRGVLIGAITLIFLNLIWVYILRRYVGVQVAPAASLTTLVLTYPFWAWRRLEQAMKYIRVEFTRMRRENGFFEPPQHLAGDQLERDLQVFESAAWQLRDLQQMVRQSMDVLPYILMLTNDKGQVILSNMEARKFFRVFPPLPTMAFEPAMGMEGGGAPSVEEHKLYALLQSRFTGNLSSQKDHNNYAKKLLLYFKHKSSAPPEGEVEVSDNKKNTSYLLKVVARTSTIEPSQGWIVSLIDLSGVQQSEVQRDQIIRYLQSNVIYKLDALQKYLVQNNQKGSEELELLQVQMDSFLAFQHAQTAVYYYEKIDLHELLEEAGMRVMADNTTWEQGGLHSAGEPVIVQGDVQMLGEAFADLMRVMVHISGGEKMPQIKVTEKMPTEEHPDIVPCAQVMLIVAIKDEETAKIKEKLLSQDVQQMGIPDEIDTDLFLWWTIKSVFSRHSGNIKIQKTPYAFAVTVELLK